MLAALANARGLAAPGVIIRPQDVFATSLYTETGSPQRITNNIDLLGRGGLVINRARSTADNNKFVDTLRGAGNFLTSDTTNAEANLASIVPAFYNDGFSSSAGSSGRSAVGWSFRRASKFFDIVTYTGDGTSGRAIPHALGIKPGMIIVKRRDAASSIGWFVYHASVGSGRYLLLNTTDAQITSSIWANTEPTATGFTLSAGADVNAAGSTYVAYLFAHDPDTTNGIVQCGSFTTNSAGTIAENVVLGWRPQLLIFKSFEAPTNWEIYDSARGLAPFDNNPQAANKLFANLSNAESGGNSPGSANVDTMATGFRAYNTLQANVGFMYLAIRAPIT